MKAPLVCLLLTLGLVVSARAEDYARYTLQTGASGSPNGAFVLLDGAGRRSIQGRLADGQLDGLTTFYTSGGQPAAEITFARGRRSGPFTLRYSGFGGAGTGRKLQGTFRDGREDGVLSSWYPDGKRRAERTLARGKLVSARLWSPQGAELPADPARAQAEQDAKADAQLFRLLDGVAKEGLAHARRQQAAPKS